MADGYNARRVPVVAPNGSEVDRLARHSLLTALLTLAAMVAILWLITLLNQPQVGLLEIALLLTCVVVGLLGSHYARVGGMTSLRRARFAHQPGRARSFSIAAIAASWLPLLLLIGLILTLLNPPPVIEFAW